ncbi:MAG TPA: type II toxin-antitoxin system VapC family toxin [Nitriliruptorales bacterium]
MTQPLVVDASAVVELLLRRPPARQIEEHLASFEAFAPELVDLEVLHVMARLERAGVVSATHACEAVALTIGLPIRRVRHAALVPRAFALRHNVSTYDASYVALAEALDASILTMDARLARAPLSVGVVLVTRAGGGGSGG